ncbi:MAG: phage terminase small subunit P27 family [FCB group bacterium]|nr:phage terminase small subunit P27 family [FCB group bacterium]
MAKTGPKPKPTRVKKLQGGQKTSHRPLPKDEPEPATSDRIPLAPRHLTKEGQKEWRRISKELHPIGLLTKLDLTALAAYCSTYAIWLDAQAQLQRHGMLIKAQSGFPMQSPYLSIATKAMAEMRKWLVEFGATPSSRTRVAVDKQDAASDLEKFMAKGKKLERVK